MAKDPDDKIMKIPNSLINAIKPFDDKPMANEGGDDYDPFATPPAPPPAPNPTNTPVLPIQQQGLGRNFNTDQFNPNDMAIASQKAIQQAINHAEELAQAKLPAMETPKATAKLMALPIDNYQAGGQGWIVTFGDLTALMVTFFVMLFAVSQLNSSQWEEVSQKINHSFRPHDLIIPERAAHLNIDNFGVGHGQELNYVMRSLNQIFPQASLLKDFVIERQNNRIILAMPNQFQFESNSANFIAGDKAEEIITALAPILNRLENQMEIYAFAKARNSGQSEDDQRNALNLAFLRAHQVANLFYENGYNEYKINLIGLQDKNRDLALSPDLILEQLEDRQDNNRQSALSQEFLANFEDETESETVIAIPQIYMILLPDLPHQ